MVCQQKIACCGRTHDLIAGCNYVRLDQIVVMIDGAVVRPKTSSWTTRTISSDFVVAAGISPETVGRTDGNCRRLVAGRVDLPVNFFAAQILAVITGRGYNDDPGIGSAAYCLA